jgi:hypothetical protein
MGLVKQNLNMYSFGGNGIERHWEGTWKCYNSVPHVKLGVHNILFNIVLFLYLIQSSAQIFLNV